MNPKQRAEYIYGVMYQITPDTLTWGSRHNIALEAAKKAVHEIMWSAPTHPCDNIEVGSQKEILDCALQYWKAVKKELEELCHS